MASRKFIQFRNSLEAGITDIWVLVNSGAGGTVPAVQQWNQGTFGSGTSYSAASATAGYGGVQKVARLTTGEWAFTFGSGNNLNKLDVYRRLLSVDATVQAATGAQDIIAVGITAGTNATGLDSTGSVATVTMLSATATAADPAASEQIMFHFTLQNTSAPLN